jgi:hypothetical protein
MSRRSSSTGSSNADFGCRQKRRKSAQKRCFPVVRIKFGVVQPTHMSTTGFPGDDPTPLTRGGRTARAAPQPKRTQSYGYGAPLSFFAMAVAARALSSTLRIMEVLAIRGAGGARNVRRIKFKLDREDAGAKRHLGVAAPFQPHAHPLED